MLGQTDREEVGASFGLFADGCRCVGGCGHIDTKFLLTGTGSRWYGGRVIAQTSSTITGL